VLALSGLRSTAARAIAVVAFLNVSIIVGAFARLVTMTRLGPGPVVALAGASVLVLASCLPVGARSSTVAAHASE
jgi:hypothetical protein